MLSEATASVAAQTQLPAAHLISVDYEHEGPAIHLNRMIRTCDTEWFSVLPDDDLLLPQHLELHTAALDDADMVFSWFQHKGVDAEKRNSQMYRGKFDARLLLGKKDSGLRAVFTARKSLWEDALGYPTGTPIDDWYFMANCTVAGARVKCVPKETWVYRFHGGNVSTVIDKLVRGESVDNPLFLSRFNLGVDACPL